MSDQAARLRSMIERKTRSITITSGKGGVGKSNFTLNFALSLQEQGYEVIIFDADMGFSNIEVLLGSRPKYHLSEMIHGRKSIWEVIHHTNEGIRLISGGSGLNELIHLNEAQMDYFIHQIQQLVGKTDFILFDTGAGLTKEAMKFIAAADETWIVTTPEPTSVTDAYALIKLVCQAGLDTNFRLVINRAASPKEGKQTAENLNYASHRFLNKEIPFLGSVADDGAVAKAVRQQIPFSLLYPNSSAAKDIAQCCIRYLAGTSFDTQVNAEKGLFHKMFQWMKSKERREKY